MNSGAFGYVDVLKTAADASWLREEVLTITLQMWIHQIIKDRTWNLQLI